MTMQDFILEIYSILLYVAENSNNQKRERETLGFFNLGPIFRAFWVKNFTRDPVGILSMLSDPYNNIYEPLSG